LGKVLEPITSTIPRRFRTVRGLVQPLVKLPRTGTHDPDMTLCRDPRALSHILDVWQDSDLQRCPLFRRY